MPLKRSKKLLLHLSLAVCCVFLTPGRAAAWGSYGHHVIAHVAAARLTVPAKLGVADLLGLKGDPTKVAEYLVKASTYADEVRLLRPETSAWHFVEMPHNAGSYISKRDCVETSQGDCAVAAIERFQKVLANRDAGPEARGEALAFLVHLVGDLHQPLHCGYKDDLGGHTLKLNFFGTPTTLHAVWDTRMISRAAKPQKGHGKETRAEDYAQRVNGLLNPALHRLLFGDKTAILLSEGKPGFHSAGLPSRAIGSAGDWAFESYQVAVKHAYVLNPPTSKKSKGKKLRRASEARLDSLGLGPARMLLAGVSAAQPRLAARGVNLEQAYYDPNVKIMDEQLLKAGIRLAQILNDSFQ